MDPERIQKELDNLVDDTNVVQIITEMTEANYVKAMVFDLKRRIHQVNPSCKIEFLSYYSFVHQILNNGLDCMVVDDESTIDFTKEYCKYIDKCADKVYTISKHYNNRDIIDFTQL
jgi:hypothetical protein